MSRVIRGDVDAVAQANVSKRERARISAILSANAPKETVRAMAGSRDEHVLFLSDRIVYLNPTGAGKHYNDPRCVVLEIESLRHQEQGSIELVPSNRFELLSKLTVRGPTQSFALTAATRVLSPLVEALNAEIEGPDRVAGPRPPREVGTPKWTVPKTAADHITSVVAALIVVGALSIVGYLVVRAATGHSGSTSGQTVKQYCDSKYPNTSLENYDLNIKCLYDNGVP